MSWAGARSTRAVRPRPTAPPVRRSTATSSKRGGIDEEERRHPRLERWRVLRDPVRGRSRFPAGEPGLGDRAERRRPRRHQRRLYLPVLPDLRLLLALPAGPLLLVC